MLELEGAITHGKPFKAQKIINGILLSTLVEYKKDEMEVKSHNVRGLTDSLLLIILAFNLFSTKKLFTDDKRKKKGSFPTEWLNEDHGSNSVGTTCNET